MTPEAIVRSAEEAHASLDIERMVDCFDPQAVIYWNGAKIAAGSAQVRAFYVDFFGDVAAFTLKKTLRAASGDTIAVEWVHTRTMRTGEVFDGVAGEFWRMKGDKLLEWHAYCTETQR